MDSEQDGRKLMAVSRRAEQETLRAMVVDVILALLECADHEKMGGATRYWPTVRKAIRVSSESSQTWGQWLEGMWTMLKIEQVRAEQSSLIYSAGESLAARDGWRELRQLLIDETALIEVTVRVRRSQRKQQSGRAYDSRPAQIGEVVDDSDDE